MEVTAEASDWPVPRRVPQRGDPEALLRPHAEVIPEVTSSPGSAPSHPPARQKRLPSPPGSAVSALQSKVRTLSACRRQTFQACLDMSVASAATHPAPHSWASSSSDDDTDPQGSPTFFPIGLEIQTGNGGGGASGFDFSPPAQKTHRLGEGSSLENLSDASCYASSSASALGGDSPTATKPWGRPGGLRKAARPETPPLNGDASLHWEVKGHGGAELQRSDSLEGHLRRLGCGDAAAALEEGAWRGAGSLERRRGGGGGGACLSLAERVEMNRSLLKQMLGGGVESGVGGGSAVALDRELRVEGTAQGHSKGVMALNDSDWDSGISLQDSEHSLRAFVSGGGEDPPLSPRHEQAKRLLDRARMTARSYPLKADHTILPVQRDHPPAAPLRCVPLAAGKGGLSAAVSTHASPSGNLSDSSSGDSACGARRRPGQSPTRVRFEDESEKDAEVRYLERLGQRRRAGTRAQGPLVSKPNLSSYVNGKNETEHAGTGNGTLRGRGRCPEVPLWHKKALQAQESFLNGVSGRYTVLTPHDDGVNRQCNSCGTTLEGAGPGPNLHPSPSTPNPEPSPIVPANGESEGMPAVAVARCWIRTESFKETYIGAVVHGDETGGGGGGTRRRSVAAATDGAGGSPNVSAAKAKRRTRRSEPPAGDGRHVAPPAPPDDVTPRRSAASPTATALPPNPYAVQPPPLVVPMETPRDPLRQCKGDLSPSSPIPIKPALKSGPAGRPIGAHGQRAVRLVPSSQFCLLQDVSPEDRGGGVDVPGPHEEPRVWGELREAGPSLEPVSSGVKHCTSPARATGETSDPESAEHAAMEESSLERASISTPMRHCGGDGQARGPMRGAGPSTVPSGMDSDPPESRSKHSLLRFFSAMGLGGAGKLGKGRSSSMEQLNLQHRDHEPTPPGPAPAPPPDSRQLRKAPSLQSLRMGSPFLQLRKSLSVQNLQSPKRKGDRASAYTPGEQPCNPALSRGLQRALSVEDVGCPSGVRSVGRVAQAFPDGTLLLELRKPPYGPFGFLIARGKGRPDSGVYVEEMADSSTEKLYAGLLAVGDEILEVNQEKVSGLSLDLVTRLMTHHDAVALRILRHRRVPPPR